MKIYITSWNKKSHNERENKRINHCFFLSKSEKETSSKSQPDPKIWILRPPPPPNFQWQMMTEPKFIIYILLFCSVDCCCCYAKAKAENVKIPYPTADTRISETIGSDDLTVSCMVTPLSARANFARTRASWPPRKTPARKRVCEFLLGGTLSDRSHGCMPRYWIIFLTASAKIKIYQRWNKSK